MKNESEIGCYIIANKDYFQEWGELVAKEICSSHAGLLKVPAAVRVKDPASARKKQFKKQYKDPRVEMTDLVGVRFVVLTSADLVPILGAIRDSSTWTHKQTRDPDEEASMDPAVFGYQSHHYELRPATGALWCCEVQVRTLLQHTIAELSHDAFYKASHAVPSQAMRLVARSIALMETTDELLCNAMQSARSIQAPYEAIRRDALFHAASVGGGGAELLDDLLEAYPSSFTYDGLESFRTFIRERQFILEKITSRKGSGIFGFPATCLIVYWIAQKQQRKIVKQWPFPSAMDDLKMILSDLGVSA